MSTRALLSLLLLLSAPLAAGTCSFSSSSGDSKIVIVTGDCDHSSTVECPSPAGSGGGAGLLSALSERPERPGPAMPEPGGWLLFAVGAALLAGRGARIFRRR